MEQRSHLNRIPELAASIWTGGPANVFWDMYYGDKTFEESMEDFGNTMLGHMEDYDMASAYEDDEFAVEKAAYQIEMAGSADPAALAGVTGMLTPWGPGLDVPDIASLLEEFPAVEVGFNTNDEGLFDEANAISNHPAFTGAVDRIEDEAEDRGLLADIKNIFSGVGDWLGENVFSPLGEGVVAQGEGTMAIGEGIGDAITDSITTAGDNWQLNQLGNKAAWEHTLGQGVSEQTNNKFMELEDKAMTREYFRVLDDILKDEGPAALKAYIGDERNYQTGELDMGMVNEWLEDYRNKISGGAADPNKWNSMQTWQNAVDAVQFSMDQVSKDVTATMQPTPRLATSLPVESWKQDIPSNIYLGDADQDKYKPYFMPGSAGDWDAEALMEEGLEPDELSPQEQMLGHPLDSTPYDRLRAVDRDLMQASGTMPKGRFTPTEEEALMEEGLDPMWDKIWAKPKEEAYGPGYPDYYTRFLNAFNQREGSGRYDYRQKLPELYAEAEMLYYLTEPWDTEGRPGDNPAKGVNYQIVEGVKLPQYIDEDLTQEHDHFTNWANQFMDNPRNRRGMFFDAAENLRDNMSQFMGVTYEDILGEEMDANTQYQRMLFMDPDSSGSARRTARLVADYNLPPDAEPWLKQRMREQMADNLKNWEAAGKTREEFLVTFMKERPY